MSQKNKVQDGYVEFKSSDSQYDLYMGVDGFLNVTKELLVGNNPASAGTITSSVDSTTHAGQNLLITTGSGIGGSGNLSLAPSGALLLNGYQWPTGSISATAGSFLGASSLNTLEFYPFIYAFSGSDTLTPSALSAAYPGISTGQYVIGNTVVYQSVGSNIWRTLGAPLGYIPVNKAGDAMTGYLTLNADPTTNLGAATKQYVDQIAQGINIYSAVETSTTPTQNLLASTYTPGMSGGSFDPGGQGVGAYLTSTGNVLLNTVGIGGDTTLTISSRILVKDQTNPIENGIYVVTDLGAAGGGGHPWVLTRASDYNNSAPDQVHAGTVVYVQKGALQGTQWAETTVGSGTSNNIIIGTDTIVFTQFAGAGTYSAGPGIDIASNIISNTGVLSNISGTGISVSASTGNVTISNTGVVSFNTRTGAITLTDTDIITALGFTPSPSSGTVTSIDVSGGTTGLNTSGGPITSTGTITLGGTLAIANGGTGHTSAQSSINALAGSVASGQYLRGNGTNVIMSTIQAADVPTLNQNTTGTSSNVTGTVAIVNGGTGQITANAGLNALLPSQTSNSGRVYTTDGTNTSWSNQMWLAPTGSVAIGAPTTAPQLATNATDGFFYIPTCAGVPTGTPTSIPGRAPMVIDSTNGRLYIYANSTWIALNLAIYS
jgi:hypothetical protein